jgi:hypothetical protein
MSKRLPKRDSTIILQLAMSAYEARLLRDELCGQLSEMDLDDATADVFEDHETVLTTSFDDWVNIRQNDVYRKRLRPVLEKTVKALRVSLGLSPEIPTVKLPMALADRDGHTLQEFRLYLDLHKKGLLDNSTRLKGLAKFEKCARTLNATYIAKDTSWYYDGTVYATFDALCERLISDFRE